MKIAYTGLDLPPGKIKHRDEIFTALARGFIRAEVVGWREMLTVHSMADARAKDLVRLAERDGLVPEGSVIEIRFSV